MTNFKTETEQKQTLKSDKQGKEKQATEGKLSCQISRRGDARLADNTNCHEQPKLT